MINNINSKIFLKICFLFFILISFNQCGIWDPADARKVPVNAKDRVAKNIEEGRSIKFGKLGQGGSGKFDFATSNVMWRATIEILDFVPLTSADYGGGIVITDWYNDTQNQGESIKIMVRFLSNEIRADGIKVVVYDRFCKDGNMLNCQTSVNKSEVSEEIKLAILKKASAFKNIDNEKKAKEYRKKKPNRPGTLKN